MRTAPRRSRFHVTVDCVVFGFDADDLKVLLVERKLPPFEGRRALPGGFVKADEKLENAARRALSDETGLSRAYLEQLYTFGDVDRDPRTRVVTVAYYALVRAGAEARRATTDARSAAWFPVARMPSLAFDHDRIVAVALERLKGKLRYQPIGFELLPGKFTLSSLQHLYEAILETPLDKRNFRKKILAHGLLLPLPETERGVAHRAARFYRFDAKRYRQLQKKGFVFEV